MRMLWALVRPRAAEPISARGFSLTKKGATHNGNIPAYILLIPADILLPPASIQLFPAYILLIPAYILFIPTYILLIPAPLLLISAHRLFIPAYTQSFQSSRLFGRNKNLEDGPTFWEGDEILEDRPKF